MKNYQINQIAWVGLILSMLMCFTSCKKDKALVPTPVVLTTTNPLVGMYTTPSSTGFVTDTIYIYEQSGYWYMTSPTIADPDKDTIGINITDSTAITIPPQVLCCGTYTVSGNGHTIGSNQLSMSWSTPTDTQNNIIYTKE